MSVVRVSRSLIVEETTCMPSPFLLPSGGPDREFYCSLCKAALKSMVPSPAPLLTGNQKTLAQAKAALLKEWNEHLAGAHPKQWQSEQRKRASRHAQGT